MKAIIYTKYGPPEVLKLQEVAKPAPRNDEVLIRVQAASINARDWRLMRANPFFIRLMVGGFLRPKYKILGVDVAGRVESVGRDIKGFRPGDEVFGYVSDNKGTFAEYVSAGEHEITLKPANLSFEQAAAVPLAAITALQGLRDKGNIQSGQKVLIQGASGGVGTFAVQFAKLFGTEVTGVCSTRNLELVRSLGADHVIDYQTENFIKSGQHYDLILAVNGYHPISDYLSVLAPGGAYVVAGGSMIQLAQAAMMGWRTAKIVGQNILSVSLRQIQEDLVFIRGLVESGKIAPVVDGCYPLSDAAEAFRYFEKVHARGKVVLTVPFNDHGQ